MNFCEHGKKVAIPNLPIWECMYLFFSNFMLGFMPLPAPLLDDSKYRTASSHHLMSHTNSTTTTNSNKTRPYSQGMLTSFEIGIAPSDTLCVVPQQGT